MAIFVVLCGSETRASCNVRGRVGDGDTLLVVDPMLRKYG
jgi:hypothetical protein